MTGPVYKAGVQSEADPFEFVMSTDARDRHGDIVEQDWNLAEFNANPIALFGHDHATPIGVWEGVRVRAGQLVGKLKLAEPGTSDLIDTLRKLVEQRILRAVSVGFSAGKATPIDEDDPWRGLRLSKNTLMETSLVSVGANPEAISLAKTFGLHSSAIRAVEPDSDECLLPAAKQLGILREQPAQSRVSDVTTPRRKNMKISERVEATRDKIKSLEGAIDALNEEMGDSMTDEQLMQLEEYTTDLEATQKALTVLERTEKSAMSRIAAQAKRDDDDDEGAAAASSAKGVGEAVRHRRIELRSTKPKGWGVMSGLACMFKGHIENQSPIMYAAGIQDHPEVEAFVKAAVNPADTATAGWASELVQDTWGEFIDLLRDTSVYPNVLGPRMSFDRYGKIHLPKNEGRGTLAGGFVAENGWIPVKEGLTGITDMSPKDMGVISTFSKKLGRHSIPQIEQLIRTQFLGDTAEVLDTLFMDATARSTTRPAGLQDATETGAGNINAAGGTGTVADIEADVEALLGRVYDQRLGDTGQWLMSRKRTLGLSHKQDAASGQFVYKAEVAAGMFSNYPIVESMNMPADVVAFIAGDCIGHGEAQAPEITTSDSTALHLNDAPTGPPDWSAFQTNSVAIKLDLGLDWRVYRQGGVQVLTGVAW